MRESEPSSVKLHFSTHTGMRSDSALVGEQGDINRDGAQEAASGDENGELATSSVCPPEPEHGMQLVDVLEDGPNPRHSTRLAPPAAPHLAAPHLAQDEAEAAPADVYPDREEIASGYVEMADGVEVELELEDGIACSSSKISAEHKPILEVETRSSTGGLPSGPPVETKDKAQESDGQTKDKTEHLFDDRRDKNFETTKNAHKPDSSKTGPFSKRTNVTVSAITGQMGVFLKKLDEMDANRLRRLSVVPHIRASNRPSFTRQRR